MKETENLSEWIEKYQSDELDQKEKSRFLSLLNRNPLLRREVMIDKELNDILSDENLLEISEKFRMIRDKMGKKRIRRIPGLIAASIFFLLTIGILILVIKRSLIDNFDGQTVAERSSENCKSEYLSANFAPVPEFEILIGSITRGPSFRLQLPQSRIIISRGTDLVFGWTSAEVQNQIKIELFNNKGNRVFGSLPFSGSRFTLHTDYFNPGIYYWKIIIDEELVTIGCITLI